MSLARFIKEHLGLSSLRNLRKPKMTNEQIMADPSLALVAADISNLGMLPLDEQSRVYKTVLDNRLSYKNLGIIHFHLRSSAYSDANAIKGYAWHRKDAKRLNKPMRDEEVVLREYVKSVGPQAMIRHCESRIDLKIAFGEIFGNSEAIKAFGHNYENTIDMDM
ncbi:hypothetical protein RBE51_17760 [Pseudomonas taiwanensis]|uniref:hypothetical protein n=1 Tax=Pseudomonas taiwanensis TaxID=470150 RepID=UPI0028DE4626|nr:hypothetical protein [Pseudomonas taiwanensis]MDT8924657.1 hypothetical protein [Pseudomonas taiwanensis]